MSRLTQLRATELPEEQASQPQPNPQAEAAAAQQAVATQMLFAALGALSKRFVVALSNLFTLLTAASSFYLWLIALPVLDNTKIIGLTIYSLFVLALNIYARRRDK